MALERQCSVLYVMCQGRRANHAHQVEFVIQELLIVCATVQLGGEAVVGVEATPRHIQPNLANCIHQTSNLAVCCASHNCTGLCLLQR